MSPERSQSNEEKDYFCISDRFCSLHAYGRDDYNVDAQKVQPYREMALKASYTSMEELEKDIKVARQNLASYINLTKGKCNEEDLGALVAQQQNEILALKEETLDVMTPYERTCYRVKQAADPGIDSKQENCSVTFKKLCYDYALMWLEQYKDSGKDHYYTIFFAVSESWKICQDEKNVRDADPAFDDIEYAESLMQVQLERGKKIEDRLAVLSEQAEYSYLNKMDKDAEREMRGDLVNILKETAEITEKDVKYALSIR